MTSSYQLKKLMAVAAVMAFTLTGCVQMMPQPVPVIPIPVEKSPAFEMKEQNISTQFEDKLAGVHLVDRIGDKWLFRGPNPLNKTGKTFDYEWLDGNLRRVAQEEGMELSGDFYLIVVSLLHVDDPGERKKIAIEENFFKKNPALGQFYSMDSWGTELSWNDQVLSQETRQQLISELPRWLGDPLPERVELLRKWLENPDLPKKNDKPVVIYVHCYEGCDRTGELIGAYLMRYKNISWEEINKTNTAYCGRPWMCRYYQAAQWYCLWLEKTQGVSLGCDLEYKCLEKFDD